MDWSTNKDLIELATRAAGHMAESIKRRWDMQKKVLCMDVRNCVGFRRLLTECFVGLSKDKLEFYIAFARHLRHRLRIKLCMMLEGVTVKIIRKNTYLKVCLTPMSFYEQRAWLVYNSRTESQHFDMLCS
jgi:uncharacterized protein YigE (DUF2233 family)